MNTVSPIGGTKRQRELASDVVEFCMSELMPRHRTLDIEVELTKCFEKDGEACCYPLENGLREFRIEIDHRIYKPFSKKWPDSGYDLLERGTLMVDPRQGYENYVTALCHEMVHVWQWVSGILEDRVYPKSLGYRTLWKGKDYTKTPYSRQPWERQAYRMQEKLFKKYLSSPLTKVF